MRDFVSEQFPTKFGHLGTDPVAITLRTGALRKPGGQNFRDSSVGGFMLRAGGGADPTLLLASLPRQRNGQTHWGPGAFLFINQQKKGAPIRACTYFGKKKALSTMWVKESREEDFEL